MTLGKTIKLPGRKEAVQGLAFETIPALVTATRASMARHECGVRISDETLRTAEHGDLSLVERSDAVMARLETLERKVDALPQTERAVAGGLCDVPAYLSGSPVAMRRRVRRATPAPLTVCCDITASGGISSAVLERRGVAVLALVRKLEAAGHPVTLHVVCGMGPRRNDKVKTALVAVRMDSQPIDLARTCNALTNEGMLREIMFQLGCDMVETSSSWISWPFNNTRWVGHIPAQQEAFGAVLGVDASSVLMVPPLHLNEADKFKSDDSAAAWVQDEYTKATAAVEL